MSENKALMSRADLLGRLSELEKEDMSQSDDIESYLLLLKWAHCEVERLESDLESKKDFDNYLIEEIEIYKAQLEDSKNANGRLNTVIESQNSLIEYYFKEEEERIEEDVRDFEDIKRGYSVLYNDLKGLLDV